MGTPAELRQKVGLVTVESRINGEATRYEHFPDRDSATKYAESLPADVKTILIRESNLEDVFVALTGKRVRDEER